ncbi:MAG: RrF2 family transcriptional regulator [Spirochaetales bacterium]|nr:RrF2 family transcriptional regulator [Spirochaetales bacterium]
MRITTKGRYGVRAVLYLASTYYNRPVSIKTIANEEGISPEFLEQIFFRLKKAGIISSHRGPGGGFILNKNTSEITIMDILKALDETIFLVPCINDKDCKRIEECISRTIWEDLSKIIKNYFTNLTIKDILEKNKTEYYEKLDSGQTFTI